jgi:hypothetical protein
MSACLVDDGFGSAELRFMRALEKLLDTKLTDGVVDDVLVVLNDLLSTECFVTDLSYAVAAAIGDNYRRSVCALYAAFCELKFVHTGIRVNTNRRCPSNGKKCGVTNVEDA